MRSSWLTYTIPELRARFTRRGWRKDDVERVIQMVKERKQQRTNEADSRRIHKEQWRNILTPLRQEWANAKQGLALDPRNRLRVKAFDHYCAVLEQAYYRLLSVSAYTEDRATPAVLARQVNAKVEATGKGFAIPNNGAHWVDWISPKRKAEVGALFYEWQTSGTKKKHAKTKEPFKRIDRKDKYEVNKAKLVTAATSERARLYQKYDMARVAEKEYADQCHYEKIKRMGRPSKPMSERLYARVLKADEALARLAKHTREDGALPRTWHGMVKQSKE